MRVALRIWLPDAPGMLGTVATAIGRTGGNVTGLEVLECQGGVAVDELIVELPGPDAVDGMCAGLRSVPGLGIEEVRTLDDGAEEHGTAVLAAAAALVGEFEHGRIHASLVAAAAELFDARWVALADPVEGTVLVAHGEPPPMAWLRAFSDGANFGQVAGATGASGVLAGLLPRCQLALCLGRPVAFRDRERREIEMLSTVADAWLATTGALPGARPA